MPGTVHTSANTNQSGLLASPARNLTFGLIFMLVVMVGAVIAYVAAGWSLGDAVYMVIITVYTVGYGEVHAIDTPLLRGITISTIVLGCTGVIFLTGALVQYITLNQINQVFGIKRMTAQIDKLTNHIILCGYGRIGVEMATGLAAGGADFVVLEADPATADLAKNKGYLVIRGDATDEASLIAAGIARARVLATVLSDDALNVFITLSARSLNPKLEIIARGELPTTESKLLQAGANKVVLPTHIGAERMVEMILYQETARFIRGSERMVDFEKVLLSLGLSMEMVVTAPGSPAVGQTIETVEREAGGAFFIVQLNHSEGDPITRPDPQTTISAGDGLVLVGRGQAGRSLFVAGGRSTFRRSARG